MYKGKSFLNFFGNLQNPPIQINQKPRSLSSKNFITTNRIINPQKRLIGTAFENDSFYKKIYQRSSNHISNQNSFLNHQERSRSQHYQNFMQPKKNNNKGLKNHARPKTDFFRSKSLNQVYKHCRIEILQQMNNQLDEYLSKRNQQQQANKRKQKQQLQTQIIAKLDKLEKYLNRIKSQREKQHNPKKRQQPIIQYRQFSKLDRKQQHIIDQRQLFERNLPIKNQYLEALSQLDKIKQQLIKTRQIAVNVKQRNSLSKNKKEVPQIYRKTLTHNLESLNKIQSNNKEEQKKYHSQFHISQNYPHNSAFQSKKVQNWNSYQKPTYIRANNHIPENNFFTQKTPSFNNPLQNPINNFQRTTSKPKITFTFSKKY